ncbi:MAG TPA: TIGR03118 family protein [Verrucomicrobiae bacterium]
MKTCLRTTLSALPALPSALCLLGSALCLSWTPSPAQADEDHDRRGAGRYRQSNLVSDLPGVAMVQDTNLVNAWGISFGPTSPFWVSANGTGLATLYTVTNDSMGSVHVVKRPLEVTIPGEGTPTGQVFNNTTNFHNDLFIFASEDGIISGWRGALGTMAETLATRSTAIYKGITLVNGTGGPRLLAANFGEGTVDSYDGSLNLVGQFSDQSVPALYAPFNVHAINGMVFVTFAKRSPGGPDDVAGPGHGLISVLDPDTGRFHRFATGSDAGGRINEFNSPWGVAVAPRTFGRHAGQLLVGNFGSGTIMAFDARGRFRGLLRGVDNHAVVIDGLWGLTFGNGGNGGSPETLYFSAGPDGEGHGLFGSLDPLKENHGDNDQD